jgi:nitrite reductase (cytochrome c-552)
VSVADVVRERPWVGWLLFAATIVVVFFIALFAASIVERRTEVMAAVGPREPIPDLEPRNAVWGEQFPRQFERYLRTLDTSFRSKYGGADFRDMLEQHPPKVVLWAGYAFSREYNQIRGHYYAVADVHLSLRTGISQPATCWTCKSTDVPRLMDELGVAGFYEESWAGMGPEVINPIGCQDCHDPQTMRLRITRPALIEALERQGRDIDRVSHQEMRSLVCAQCHVEYYFQGEGNYLVFPWDKGTDPDQVEAYFDEIGHVDWTHALSRAPMIKIQHPDYELFLTGVHAERGVSCADCHMPYRREGGVKITDHHIQSPLADIDGSCLVCHAGPAEDLLDTVYTLQDRLYETRREAEGALARLHIEAQAAWEAGATDEEMAPVLALIRSAQFYWDWVAASHGASFHAPSESARIMARSLTRAAEGRLLLSRILFDHGVAQPVPMPDLTDKAALQAYIGLDMAEIRADKARFLREDLPVWQAQAAERREGPTDYVPQASIEDFEARWGPVGGD